MKNKCSIIIFILFLQYMNSELLDIDSENLIKTIYSSDSFNDKYYSVYNPINGTDFWQTKKICCGQSASWYIELNEETYILYINQSY